MAALPPKQHSQGLPSISSLTNGLRPASQQLSPEQLSATDSTRDSGTWPQPHHQNKRKPPYHIPFTTSTRALCRLCALRQLAPFHYTTGGQPLQLSDANECGRGRKPLMVTVTCPSCSTSLDRPDWRYKHLLVLFLHTSSVTIDSMLITSSRR